MLQYAQLSRCNGVFSFDIYVAIAFTVPVDRSYLLVYFLQENFYVINLELGHNNFKSFWKLNVKLKPFRLFRLLSILKNYLIKHPHKI